MGGSQVGTAVADAVTLQQHTHIKDLVDILTGELLDERPLVRDADEQPVRRETEQGLAHRTAADAELLAKLGLLQPVAGRVQPVADIFAQDRVNLIRNGLNRPVFWHNSAS